VAAGVSSCRPCCGFVGWIKRSESTTLENMAGGFGFALIHPTQAGFGQPRNGVNPRCELWHRCIPKPELGNEENIKRKVRVTNPNPQKRMWGSRCKPAMETRTRNRGKLLTAQESHDITV